MAIFIFLDVHPAESCPLFLSSETWQEYSLLHKIWAMLRGDKMGIQMRARESTWRVLPPSFLTPGQTSGKLTWKWDISGMLMGLFNDLPSGNLTIAIEHGP